MRIPHSWIPIISKNIAGNLITKRLIEPQVSIDKLKQRIEDVLFNELSEEDRLNDEVREILKGYQGEIEKKGLDYKKLFDMTKRKLIKERNIVI